MAWTPETDNANAGSLPSGSTLVQCITKTGQPSTASPRTVENNRRKLGGLLSSFGFGGSPLRRKAVDNAFTNHNDNASRPQDGGRSSVIQAPVSSFTERMAALALNTGKGKSKERESESESYDSTRALTETDQHEAVVSLEPLGACSLFRLPDELLIEILSYLPPTPQQLHTLSRVSRRVYTLSQAPILWARAFDATPGFKLDPHARDNGVAVREPPKGRWESAAWHSLLEGGAGRSEGSGSGASADRLKDREGEEGEEGEEADDYATTSSPNAIAIHFPTLYRSRAALSTQIRHPSKYKPHIATVSQHTDAVYCVQSAGEWLVSGSRDKSVRIWRLPPIGPEMGEPQLIHTIHEAHQGSVLALHFEMEDDDYTSGNVAGERIERKAKLVTCSSDGTAKVWTIVFDAGRDRTTDPQTGASLATSSNAVRERLVGTLHDHDRGVLDIALTKENIITCSRDATLRVYDRNNLSCLHVLRGHTTAVNCLAVNINATTAEEGLGQMVSASGDGSWIIWGLKEGIEVRRGAGDGRGLACIAWDGDYLVTGDNDGLVKLYLAQTGQPVKTFEGHQDLVRTVSLDAERGLIASGSYDKSIRLWNTTTGETMILPQGGRESLVFDLELRTNRLFSASQDNTVQILTWGRDLPYSELFV